jgi:hypothetical protein
VAALSSRPVGEIGGVVFGCGKPICRCAGATPKHVFLVSTQVEHRSPTKGSAMRCLWCGQ